MCTFLMESFTLILFNPKNKITGFKKEVFSDHLCYSSLMTFYTSSSIPHSCARIQTLWYACFFLIINNTCTTAYVP